MIGGPASGRTDSDRNPVSWRLQPVQLLVHVCLYVNFAWCLPAARLLLLVLSPPVPRAAEDCLPAC